MSEVFPFSTFRWLWPAFLVLLAGSLAAQDTTEQEPRFLRLRVPETHLGAEMEALREEVTLNGLGTSTHDFISAIPLAGGRAQGSLYHPNLLSFDVNGEGGIGWAQDRISGPGFNVTRHEDAHFLRYLATVNLLSAKPYNASFFASQDHTFQNYDFFNTATVDSWRYGGQVAWTTKDFDLNTDFGYRDDRASGLTGTSDNADTYFHFNGINRRERGSSSLLYRYDNYENTFDAGATQDTLNQSVGLSDSEEFGSRRQITATTGLNYSQYSFFNEETETFEGSENVTINHLPNLDSFYNLTYDHSRQAPTSSSLVQGMVGLRHRLYENLTSTLDAHGTYDESAGAGSSAWNDRYGLGLAESYTRHLQSWGQLSLGGAVIGDHEDHVAEGGVLTVVDEPHQLFAPGSVGAHLVFLDNPRVLPGSVSVRTTDGRPLLPNVDYRLIPSGQLTRLELLPTSLLLPSGTTLLAVLASYQSLSLFNAAFESLNGSVQVRLDLFRLFGVYGRLNSLANNAPPQALVETLTDWTGGVDATWRWLRAGTEYEDFDSSFTRYTAWRFFESFTFQPGASSTLGFEFNQVFYRYPGSRDETQYQFISHLTTQLAAWLWWYVEGGYYLDDAFGTEQALAAARTGLSFNWGKLTIKTGYDYNHEVTHDTFAREQRGRHFVYLYLRRSF